MEIKKAIELLQDVLFSLPGKYEEALQMAISALEKQEPKKPRTERTDYDTLGDYCINCYCPCCNRRVVSKDSTGWFAGKPVKYCECGQKIDWSEVDDG